MVPDHNNWGLGSASKVKADKITGEKDRDWNDIHPNKVFVIN